MAGRYELITGNAAGAQDAWRQILELYELWTTLKVPAAFKADFGKNLEQELCASHPDEDGDSKVKGAFNKRKASDLSPTSTPGSRHVSSSGSNKRHARDIRPPHGSDSECSVDSDTPLTEAEVKEINEALKMVSAWRTASSKALSQSHQREKTVASREDIGGYEQEPPRLACTVDLNPEGPPADYYPPHLVAAALNDVEIMCEYVANMDTRL